jgi:hypothetical protein
MIEENIDRRQRSPTFDRVDAFLIKQGIVDIIAEILEAEWKK